MEGIPQPPHTKESDTTRETAEQMLARLENELFNATGTTQTDTGRIESTGRSFFTNGSSNIDLSHIIESQSMAPHNTHAVESTQTEQNSAVELSDTEHEERIEQLKHAVDTVMQHLDLAITDVGLTAMEKYQNLQIHSPDQAKSYLEALQSLTVLAHGIKALIEGDIKLIRNTSREDKVSKPKISTTESGERIIEPDTVRIFDSEQTIKLDNYTINGISIFVRPRQWRIRTSRASDGEMVDEWGPEARMTIMVRSPDVPNGIVSMRIDDTSNNKRKKDRLTYDFDIKGESRQKYNRWKFTNLIDELDLSEKLEAGHHYISRYTVEDLGVQPSQIYEALIAIMDSYTHATALNLHPDDEEQ